ncbi:MAG TPA: glycosyltransferase family 2 protein [Flavisolibacter sp.]|nr:glycosyltransferase family 2 protein [Flavisolibacter sp.]
MATLLTSPSVAVVILNWNGKKYLEQFLPSVQSTTYPNYKIVVIDNASSDDSITFLKEHFLQIEIIALSENFGFSKGYNEGLRSVQADYYILLNSDVEVTPGWIDPMVELLEQDKRHAACQPKLLAFHQKNQFEYAGAAGGWIDSLGYPFARGRVFDTCEEDKGQYNDIVEVFWASGAALMIRSQVYHELNGFDDFFFAHQEEIDLCWRIHLAGYKIFSCPSAVVYHVGGGTLPKGSARKTFLNFRNNNIMLAKNLPLIEKWWKLPLRMLLDQVTAFKELLGGDRQYFIAIQKAHIAFLKWFVSQKNSNKNYSIKSMRQIPGVYSGSLIWQYFIKKKKLFSEIVGK